MRVALAVLAVALATGGCVQKIAESRVRTATDSVPGLNAAGT